MIDDVQDRVRPPLVHAVLDRRQVGSGVEERAVLLLDDHRHVVALQEDADRAVAFVERGPFGKLLNHAAEPILVKAFAERVVERDAEPAVHDFDFGQAGGQKLAPQFDVRRIAAVEAGGFQQHLLADIGVGSGQLAQARDRLRWPRLWP